MIEVVKDDVSELYEVTMTYVRPDQMKSLLADLEAGGNDTSLFGKQLWGEINAALEKGSE